MQLYPDLLKHQERFAAKSDTGECLTYKNLFDFSEITNEIIDPRSVVFVLCENSIGSFAGCVAFLNCSVVPVLLSASIDRSLLNRLLITYNPEYLYIPERVLAEFSDLQLLQSHYGYVLLRTPYDSRFSIHKDLALLIPTSGSTGSPKLVRHSYENLSSNGRAIIEYLDIDKDERPITSLPMQYSFGYSIINSHLLAGATTYLTTRTIVEKEFWSFINENSISSFAGVPYTFEILERLRFFRMEIPSLKTMIQAGGKLPVQRGQKIADFAYERNIKFFIMYGQTEASPRMSYLPAKYAKTNPGSIGVAIPGGELFLQDKDGLRINESNREGELIYRGENVTLGYADCRKDLLKGDERDGTLHTGDMAYRDNNGFYYITGRQQRFIKLFGNRVSLDEAEILIRELVSDCACCGSDDKMDIYITESGMNAEVRSFIAARTGIHPSAFRVKLTSEIPKNEAGKTLYSELETRANGA